MLSLGRTMQQKNEVELFCGRWNCKNTTALQILYLLKNVVCPIKTIRRYNSLPTLAAKYTRAQTVFTLLTVINIPYLFYNWA